MTKTYYECHITIEAPNFLGEPRRTAVARRSIKEVVEEIGWKFSAIEGDIVMGEGVKLYATHHYNSKLPADDVVALLKDAAAIIDGRSDAKILRRKVELVIYDDRSSKVKPCDGGCVECHLDDIARDPKDGDEPSAAIPREEDEDTYDGPDKMDRLIPGSLAYAMRVDADMTDPKPKAGETEAMARARRDYYRGHDDDGLPSD
jgi:hypothetical protein